MYCIVLGAEPEGHRFIEMAVERGHEVTLIEQDEAKARRVLKNSSIKALVGSIAKDDILQEAEMDRAEAVIATTYDDALNLMAMVLAKEHNIAARVSLVNEKRHSKIFEQMDVRVLNDPATLIAQKLYDLLD